MKCTNCNAKLKPGTQFCPNCGTKLETRRFCTSCGAELAAGEQFCGKCGTQAAGTSPAAPKKKLWIGIAAVIVVLALAVTGAFLLFGGNSVSGAETAQEAVENYCRALNCGDLPGALAAAGVDYDAYMKDSAQKMISDDFAGDWEAFVQALIRGAESEISNAQEHGADPSEVEAFLEKAKNTDSEKECLDLMGQLNTAAQKTKSTSPDYQTIDLELIADAEVTDMEINEMNPDDAGMIGGVFTEFCSYQRSDVVSCCSVALPDAGSFVVFGVVETKQGWFVVSYFVL